VFADLEAAGATHLVPAAELTGWFRRAIDGDPGLKLMGDRARSFVEAGYEAAGGGCDRVLSLLSQ